MTARNVSAPKALNKTGMSIANAKLLAGSRETRYRIEGERGLILAVQGGGERLWRLRYRDTGGKEVWSVLGNARAMTVLEAAAAAQTIRDRVAKGQDPKTAAVVTVADLATLWREKHANGLRKAAAIATMLETQILPLIGAVELSRLHRDDFRKVRDAVAVKRLVPMVFKGVANAKGKTRTIGGPAQSRSCMVVLQSMCNWGVDAGHLPYNVGHGLKHAEGSHKPRQRVIAEKALPLFWRALEAPVERARTNEHRLAGEQLSRVLRLVLLTGCRISEALGMATSELHDLDSDNPVWLIPAERMKSGRDHAFPLVPSAVAVIKEALSAPRAHQRNDHVVFCGAGGGVMPPASAKTKVRRLCVKAGIAHVSPHDLRRTVGTGMAKLQIPEEVRSKVLAHAKKGVTDVHYNAHDGLPEKRDALLRWEAGLLRLIDGKPIAPSAGRPALRVAA